MSMRYLGRWANNQHRVHDGLKSLNSSFCLSRQRTKRKEICVHKKSRFSPYLNDYDPNMRQTFAPIKVKAAFFYSARKIFPKTTSEQPAGTFSSSKALHLHIAFTNAFFPACAFIWNGLLFFFFTLGTDGGATSTVTINPTAAKNLDRKKRDGHSGRSWPYQAYPWPRGP